VNRQQRIEAKGRRLFAEGRVHRVADGIYTVFGDSAAYLVTLAPAESLVPDGHTGERPPACTCTCPANGACSHLHAALNVLIDEGSLADVFRDLVA
jgi:hypothetical protein